MTNDPLERNKRNVTAFYDLAFNQRQYDVLEPGGSRYLRFGTVQR